MISYSGIQLNFKAPDISKTMVYEDGFDQLYNIYDNKNYKSAYYFNDKHHHGVDCDVPSFASFELEWSLYNRKIWKQWVMNLNFSIMIRKIPRNCNLFIPEHFERAVLETIDAKFGPYSSRGEYGRRFEGPLDWQYQQINSLDWISYNIQELKQGSDLRSGDLRVQWCTPLTSEHFLSFEFNNSNRDLSQIPYTAVDTIIKLIVNSCDIDFTTDVQQSREQAQQQNNSSMFSDSHPPRYWIIYDDDPEQFLGDAEQNSLLRQRELIDRNNEKKRDKYFGIAKPTIDEQFDTQREQARHLRQQLDLQGDQDPDDAFGPKYTLSH